MVDDVEYGPFNTEQIIEWKPKLPSDLLIRRENDKDFNYLCDVDFMFVSKQ